MSETDITVIVALVIRGLRQLQGLTTAELAARSGVSESTVEKTERNGNPRFNTLLKFAAGLKVEPAQLIDPAMLDEIKGRGGLDVNEEPELKARSARFESRDSDRPTARLLARNCLRPTQLKSQPKAEAMIAPYPQTISVHQAAKRLGSSDNAVLKRIRHGTLRATKPDRRWLIDGESVDRLIAERERRKMLASLPKPKSLRVVHSWGPTIGQKIQEQQKRLHLSDAQLSRQSGVPVNVLRWTKRGHNPGAEAIQKIARALGVEVSSLAGRSIKPMTKGRRKTEPRP